MFKLKYFVITFLIVIFSACTHSTKVTASKSAQVHSNNTPKKSVLIKHGKLAVKGNQIVNAHGVAPMLAGPSFFWSNNAWPGEEYYRENVVEYFVNDWHASIVRAAIGVEASGGYLTNPLSNRRKAEVIIDAAIKNGIYVILDFHSHEAEKHLSVAQEFFTYFAKKYGEYDNIIYEIYNEPLRETDWETQIKPYSEAVIKTIRSIDPDNLILVGSQSWSQDVDKSSLAPITAYENIAYTLHFYAGSHRAELRHKAKVAIDNGLPLLVSEWGGVNADGDGAVDKQSVDEWVDFMREHQLSHLNWSVSRKKEGASIFTPQTQPNIKFSDSDLTESGQLVKAIVSNWAHK